MSILSWNCRGSGGTKITTLNRYLRCTKVQVAFISETKCGEQRSYQRISKLSLCNAIVVPSEGRSGGLWLLWGSEVTVFVKEKGKYMIVVDIQEKQPTKNWRLIAVYGDLGRSGNARIWGNIEAHLTEEDIPTIVVGDFNARATQREKWGGIQQMSNANRAFGMWIHAVGLLDLGHNGPAYTWTNKKRGDQVVEERLDRALANLKWSLANPEAAVFHLPCFNSDHLPILIRTETVRRQVKNRFRCENWWSLHEGFREVCEKTAVGRETSWKRVTEKFKIEVGKWVKKIKTPEAMLKGIEAEMLQLNSTPRGHNTRWKEEELQRQHTACLLMLENFWHQRSRIQWASLGDKNTSFFSCLCRNSKKKE